MRFEVDVTALAVVLELDTEPANLDLTAHGLGDACLDAAVEGMLQSHRARVRPEGTPWAPLKAATVCAKGHAVIGVRSGILLHPDRWRSGERTIEARYAAWFYPETGVTGDGSAVHAASFHGGTKAGLPARPLFGWTEGAQQECRRLLDQARRR